MDSQQVERRIDEFMRTFDAAAKPRVRVYVGRGGQAFWGPPGDDRFRMRPPADIAKRPNLAVVLDVARGARGQAFWAAFVWVDREPFGDFLRRRLHPRSPDTS